MTTERSNLAQLVDIIATKVKDIEKLATDRGVRYPTIDTLYDARSSSEQFIFDPEVRDAAVIAISAASQLIATLKLPVPSLFERATGFHLSTAIRIVSETSVIELLREAGPKGMHVRDIAAKTNTDASMIGRSLRILATHYVFKEVEPDVFANNRLSSLMDTGKDSDLLVALARDTIDSPTGELGVTKVQSLKYENTNGIRALLDVSTDYLYKAASFVPDVFLSKDNQTIPFQVALQRDDTLWDFFESHPGHLRRFQTSMEAWTLMSPENIQSSSNGFDWTTLQNGSLVVDVGGGNGSVSFDIAKRAPHITVLVQDRDQTIDNVTIPTWQADPEKKTLLDSGRVRLEGQSFFDEQPAYLRGVVSMFFMRYILHDWSSEECLKILHRLHEAASESTKLLIVDQVVPYACPTQEEAGLFIGSNLPPVPEPLLANLGEATSPTYRLDMAMEALFHGQERTLGEFRELTQETGWRIERIYQTRGSAISQILCSRV
ncbi:S-adenosyl-L-methionine-dependent methyltransferase [Cyathus striatus]|nr:S-adenosyl-L-methionine-dependent methyltransferase [Cyathus striatus]